MKKLLALVLVIVMALSLAACSSPEAAQPAAPAEGGEAAPAQTFELKASTYLSESDSLYHLLEEYCASVAEKTNGGVTITLYPSEQLGGYEQTFEETMRGTLEFGFNAIPGSFDNRLECFYIPGAISTYERMEACYKKGSTCFNTAGAALDDLGITMLGTFLGGYNNLCLNCDVPANYADPTASKDLVCRVPTGFAIIESIVSNQGYRTAGLPGSDVYSALQTGVVDATVGQSNGLVYSAYSDVIKNIVENKQTCSADFIFMNKELFESMPQEYQDILFECADKFFADNIAQLKSEGAEIEQKLKDEKGITVVHLTDEEQAALDNHMIETIWPSIEEKYGADFIAGVKADVGMN